METSQWPGSVRTSQASAYADQSVLILDQESTRCIANKCEALCGLLQRSLAVSCIQERCGSQLPQQIAFVPDLVVVRPAIDKIAPELIASCKEKWSSASILALICQPWDRLLDNLPSFLTRVDDFLSCPFHETELLLRVKRLL